MQNNHSGGPGEPPTPPPRLVLDQSEAHRAKKEFFFRPPATPYLKVLIRH